MPDLVGTTILRRYRVDEAIGRGGMAEVYKVWDGDRSVYLAMKRLHADLAEDQVFLRRFRREAQTLARLQHPHIVRFYGMEADGELVFLLMDYVEGITLRTEIARRKAPFAPERILEIMRPVCAALHYAHNQGFVHCDVKPANIMIHKSGNVLLSDFGIARLTETATSTMVGAGTPAYMSPEQIRGERFAPQTDIYALGITLYEMLTGGERPFTGEQAQTTGSTMERVRWEQLFLAPPSPRRINPSVPPAMADVVLKCLEKESARRFGSVSEMIKAVEAAYRPAPAEAAEPTEIVKPPRGAVARPAEQPQREIAQPMPAVPDVLRAAEPVKKGGRISRPGLGVGIMIGVVSAALVLAALALGGPVWRQMTAGAATTQTPAVQAIGGTPGSEAAAAPTISSAPFYTRVSVRVALQDIPDGKLLAVLNAHSLVQVLPDTKVVAGTAWIHIITTVKGKQLEGWVVQGSLESATPEAGGSVPTGNYPIAFVSNRDGHYAFYKMNADGSGVTRIAEEPAIAQDIAWAPRGDEFAFASKRDSNWEIYSMNADGTGLLRLTQSGALDQEPSWSPDGTKIAFVSKRDGNWRIYTMNPDGGALLRISNGLQDEYPTWSPDGSRIAFTSLGGAVDGIFTMHPDGSGLSQLYAGRAASLAWSHDGKKIAFTSWGTAAGVYTMNAQGTNVTRLVNKEGDYWDLSWSPDGNQIIFSFRDNCTNHCGSEIYTVNADGSDLTNITNSPADDVSPAWSPVPDQPSSLASTPPDASTTSDSGARGNYRIAFVSNRDGNDRIYSMDAQGGEVAQLTNTNGRDAAPAWSPDGTKIVFMHHGAGYNPGGDIYTMTSSGGESRRISSLSADAPAWSISNKIAFEAVLSSRWNIFTVSPDGNSAEKITVDGQEKHSPAWSPDGVTLAFDSVVDGNWDIYLMSTAGNSKAKTRLTYDGASHAPAWSPDGTSIAYQNSRSGNWDIYIINLKTRHVDQLTDNTADDISPTWSPDGKQIAFASRRDGNYEIYVMNADGSDPINITHNPADDTEPAWSWK